MKEQGFTFEAWSAISKRAITLSCFAFVDDTYLILSNVTRMSTEDFIAKGQRALWEWEGLLTATGGQLHEDKSYWYFVEVIWRNGRWGYRPLEEIPGELYLFNRGQAKQIAKLTPHQAKEALGIYSRPDGDMKEELAYLIQRAKEYAESCRIGKYSKKEAWYCLNSTIMRTIEYPLMATSFTRDQCDKIMRPLKSAIQKAGVQKKLPHKLLYGPLSAQGLNIKDPYWSQLISHLQAIQRHIHRDTPSRDLHLENMEAIQCLLGSATPFWDLPFETWGQLAPDGWTKSTWRQLQEANLSFKGPLETVPKKRENDQHLMDVFATQ